MIRAALAILRDPPDFPDDLMAWIVCIGFAATVIAFAGGYFQ